MNGVLNFLGFTGLSGTFWNILAYLGMFAIIVAVVSKNEKWQNHFFFWGPLALFLYAAFFLHNPLLAGLQFIIAASGLLNLLEIKKYALLRMGVLTVIIYSILLISGSISGIWCWIGSFGLLGIGLGLTQLPKKRSFAIMAVGGALIVVYSGALQIWVWFVLNIIFFALNLIEAMSWERKKVKDFVLCWFGWLLFCSATATICTAIHRNVTGGFLGPATEIPIYGLAALFFAIWWFLSLKK